MIRSESVGNLKTLKTVLSNDSLLEHKPYPAPAVKKTHSDASLLQSNDISALLEFHDNDLNHPSGSSNQLDGIKFEDIFTEVQSPDYSIWESLFTDQVDFSSDFMVYSPKRMSSDVKMASPKTTMLTGNQNSSGYNNHNYNNGHQQLGRPASPSQLSAYHALQKGKAQSPLHRVFNSPKNQYMQQHESFSLPGVEALMDDYPRELLGAYNSTKKSSGFGSSPDHFEMTLLEMLDSPVRNPTKFTDAVNEAMDFPASAIPNSSKSGDVVNEFSASGGSQITQDRESYQLNSIVKTPLSQQQQHQRREQQQQQQQQQQHESLSYSLVTPLSSVAEQVDFTMEQDSGLQLVHLLLACAEAVAKEEYMSARRYLHHLNRIVSSLGDSMQRVASCFTDALGARLAQALTTTSNPNSSSTPKPFTPFIPNSLETLKIYQIVYQACPYIKFAHFTANQAIFEAFETEERVHVIDLDILQGYQWPAFMQALAGRRNGPPFLRITGVGYPQEAVRETGRGLTELAHSLHIRFAFHPVAERLEDLKPHMFHRRIGEALAVNSVNCLHRVPGSALGNLLIMIRDQAPNIVTLVEQESSHNGPYFLGRFLEALHYYSAIFDSLDATFPIDSAERAKVEQYIFAPEIRNIVACEGAERVERHERLEKWRKIMESKGFKGVALSGHAVSQSKLLLGLYPCDGYRLREDRGCLLLGWQDRAVIAASAWRC